MPYTASIRNIGAVILSGVLVTSPVLARTSASETICESCSRSLSESFIFVAKECRPAVVHIHSEIGGPSNGSQFGFQVEPNSPFEDFQEELFNRFFGVPSGGEKSGPQKPHQASDGSGFIVSSDGYIVTNHHVVKDATRITVEKFDDIDREYIAQIVGCDPKTDIAILKIEATDLPYLEFADSDEIQAGQWTMAIGHPFKLRDSVTAGVISATHRGDLQISQLEDFIQTDTSINPGNSGGPLLDLSGRVIGVNTAILSRTGGSIGLGFAVPSNIVSMVFEQIRQKGAVDRAFLGVQIQDLNDDLCTGFKLKKGTTGALIADVVEDSSAESAGLKSGDIVVKFNGQSIKSSKQLYTTLGKISSGTKCKLTVLRDGIPVHIEMVLGSRTTEVSQVGDIIHKLGVSVEQITPENAHKFGVKTDDLGLVITKIIPQTIASMIGWAPGGIIMVVNGVKTHSITDLKKALELADPDERVVVLMNYKGRASFHSIPHPMK